MRTMFWSVSDSAGIEYVVVSPGVRSAKEMLPERAALLRADGSGFDQPAL